MPTIAEEIELMDKAKLVLRKLEKPEKIQLRSAKEVRQAYKQEEGKLVYGSSTNTFISEKTNINPEDYISTEYTPLPFGSPTELLLTLNPHLVPYTWQSEVGMILSGKLNPYENKVVMPTSDLPLYLCIAAANGSGKDCFIVAPFAVWMAVSKIRARVIITSSSHEQIRDQTEHYIKSLVEQCNRKFGADWFDSIKYHYVCRKTGSEIKLFVTDEPGKAEGYHPFPDYPGAEMAIIKNESKSIPDGIADSLSRCTGFNYWIDVSSPGPTTGFFYRSCTTADTLYPEWPKLGETWFRRVTAYECPHISKSEIERKRKFYGESSPFFRSSVLAEFTSTESQVVIPYDQIYKIYQNPPEENKFDPIFAGLDFGGGGDENVLSVWHGNTQIGLECFRFHETERTVEHVINLIGKYKIPQEHIIADDNGIGQAILGHLADKGFRNIRKLHAQGAAHDKSAYGNCGAEIWFKFGRFVSFLRLLRDEKQLNQLANRYYEQRGLGKIYLERKAEARASGHSSPDRADATVLAFADKPEDYFDNSPTPIPKKPTVFRQEDLIQYIQRSRRQQFVGAFEPENKRYRGSVTSFVLWNK